MPFIKEQLTTDNLVLSMLYSLGAVSVVLVVLALGFIDVGLVRRKNTLDTWIQKLVSALVAGGGTLVVGYGIWNWQFNSAFGVPHPLGQALKDWWLGGQFQTHFAGAIDPKVLPEADVQQIFLVFFVVFSMGTLALIHTGAMERMKPAPLYTMAAIIGLVLSPLVAYFCWGPVGPLTNHGTHDFDGIFPLYIFAGTWVAVLSWRLKPRVGAFSPHASGTTPAAQNVGMVATGVLIIMFALPFIALSSGFVVPGEGFFGISFTESGFGIVLTNIFTAYIGGGIAGAIIAYRRREPVWALMGPLAGAVICGTLFDVGKPWEVLILSVFGPVVALGTTALLRRLRIDEPKVVPLALGPGIVGAVATGFIAWHTKTGGYPGLEGGYALGHAEITPWMQLAGVAVDVALAGIPCLIICLLFEKTTGLRVTEAEEIAGMDRTYWDVDNYGDEPVAAIGGRPDEAAVLGGVPVATLPPTY
jgi:ammonia channel protein AmtB